MVEVHVEYTPVRKEVRADNCMGHEESGCRYVEKVRLELNLEKVLVFITK